MDGLQELSKDKRLRNHFCIDQKRRSSLHRQKSPHFHSYYEIYYMQEGSSLFTVGEKVYPLEKGNVLFIPPGFLHLSRYPNPGLHDRFNIYYDLERVPRNTHPFVNILLGSSPQHLMIPPEQEPEINGMLSRMLEYYRFNNAYGEAMNEHLFPVLLLFLSQVSEPISMLKSGSIEESLSRAATFLSEHYMEPLTLEQASQVAGFAPSYFSRKFKEMFGLGFREYLTHLRIKEGARLLRTTMLPIQEVAHQSGFGSANYFGDAFKAIYHISPRDFRKKEEVGRVLSKEDQAESKGEAEEE